MLSRASALLMRSNVGRSLTEARKVTVTTQQRAKIGQKALLAQSKNHFLQQPIPTLNSFVQVRYLRWAKRKVATEVTEAPIPKVSEDLAAKAPEALVIDEKGVNLGIIATADIIAQANARGLRVVVVRDSKPPVYKLEAPQRAETATKSSKGKAKSYDPDALHERIKEIRISDKITEHDLQVKISKTMQHLLSRHRVKVELKFKYRTEFDPVVAKALMENVVARLAEISTIETPMKSMDDRACFMMLKPLPTKQLIARGFLEDPSKVSEKDDEVDMEVAAAREKAASREERNRAAQLEKEELKQQGLLKKRFKSPVEQTKDEDDKDRLKGKPEKKREEPEDEDEYGYDDEEDEDIDFGPGRRR